MKKKKSNNLLMLGGLAVLAIIIIVILSLTKQPEQHSVINYTGEFQDVELRVQGATYIMTPSELKVGVPVRMVADMDSVKGCARAVVIPVFGVQKNLGTLTNVIEFVPTRTGEFDIMCTMQMYTGKFKVVE